MSAQSDNSPASNLHRLDRRGFLRTTGALAAGTLAAPAILRGRDLNSRLNIAIIGVGGRGAANLEAVVSENIVALCDVYEPALTKAAQRFPHAKTFADYRRLYDHAADF